MKNKKILFTIILILLVAIILLGVMLILTNQKLDKNLSIYCSMEDNVNQNKMELYFDFKDGRVYRYSIINTNKLTENINVDAYMDLISNSNNKYKGLTQKFWTDNNIYMTTEIYNLDLLSESEFKELTGMSLKELKTKTRKEIIDSIIPMGENGNFQCN